jgi:hypothetical protein
MSEYSDGFHAGSWSIHHPNEVGNETPLRRLVHSAWVLDMLRPHTDEWKRGFDAGVRAETKVQKEGDITFEDSIAIINEEY